MPCHRVCGHVCDRPSRGQAEVAMEAMDYISSAVADIAIMRRSRRDVRLSVCHVVRVIIRFGQETWWRRSSSGFSHIFRVSI